MISIRADPDPKHWFKGLKSIKYCLNINILGNIFNLYKNPGRKEECKLNDFIFRGWEIINLGGNINFLMDL